MVPGGTAEAKRDVLQAMCDRIAHRGPDGQGLLFRGQAGLGHRRLSIIDLGGGAQPMSTEDGRLAVVFNGEIYNFPELRHELERKGYAFRTSSDTEILLHGYDAWGPLLLQRLNGMFAFALWDAPHQRLFAARDRLGKKPFYYHHDAARFLFGSELKSILAEPSVSRDIDPQAMDDYFSFGYIPAPLTAFKAVQKLRPGHSLTWENGKLEIAQYWDVRYGPDPDCKTEDDYVDKLEELLGAAVKRRLLSDVPLGAFLSGGIDSGTIVGLMAKVAGGPVRTCTSRRVEMPVSFEPVVPVARTKNTRYLPRPSSRPGSGCTRKVIVPSCPVVASGTTPTLLPLAPGGARRSRAWATSPLPPVGIFTPP